MWRRFLPAGCGASRPAWGSLRCIRAERLATAGCLLSGLNRTGVRALPQSGSRAAGVGQRRARNGGHGASRRGCRRRGARGFTLGFGAPSESAGSWRRGGRGGRWRADSTAADALRLCWSASCTGFAGLIACGSGLDSCCADARPAGHGPQFSACILLRGVTCLRLTCRNFRRLWRSKAPARWRRTRPLKTLLRVAPILACGWLGVESLSAAPILGYEIMLQTRREGFRFHDVNVSAAQLGTGRYNRLDTNAEGEQITGSLPAPSQLQVLGSTIGPPQSERATATAAAVPDPLRLRLRVGTRTLGDGSPVTAGAGMQSGDLLRIQGPGSQVAATFEMRRTIEVGGYFSASHSGEELDIFSATRASRSGSPGICWNPPSIFSRLAATHCCISLEPRASRTVPVAMHTRPEGIGPGSSMTPGLTTFFTASIRLPFSSRRRLSFLVRRAG